MQTPAITVALLQSSGIRTDVYECVNMFGQQLFSVRFHNTF